MNEKYYKDITSIASSLALLAELKNQEIELKKIEIQFHKNFQQEPFVESSYKNATDKFYADFDS